MAELLLLTGAGLLATSQIQEGRAAEKQGEFTKEIALRNQQALERQAKAEREAASVKEQQISRQEKLTRGAQIATAGKFGGQIAGATLNALADTARQFSLSRNFALRSGLFKSQELKERGNIIAAQGRFASSVGKSQKRLSYIKAGGTLLMAGSKLDFGGGGTGTTFSGASSGGNAASRGVGLA